jgi:hypothetical protein
MKILTNVAVQQFIAGRGYNCPKPEIAWQGLHSNHGAKRFRCQHFFNNDDIHRHDSQLLAYALVLQIAACRPKGVQQWWFVQK